MLIIRREQMDALAARSRGGDAVQPCPLQATWIEVELVGEDGRPIAGERYRLVAPDGAVREGTLDDRGMARVEGVRAGSCEVTFPDLDGEAWERR
jgi:hypothetical protein